MERRIRIKAAFVEVVADLNDTGTAQAIWEALPIAGRANLWGNEIYFAIPLDIKLEEGQEVVEVGDLGYWPPGHAFCIFFGPTPASRGDEVRPASAVCVFGKVCNDAPILKQIASGTEITIEKENSD